MAISWEKVCDQLNSQAVIYSMVVFEDRLYASTGSGGRLFRLNLAGDAWEQVCAQLNSQTEIMSLCVFNDRLYGGTASGGRLFRLNLAGNAWEQVCAQLNSQTHIISLIVFEDRLYGGTASGGRLFRLNLAGNAWEQVCAQHSAQTHIECLCIFEDRLYGGTYSGGNLFRLNLAKDAWEQICLYYDDTRDITSLIVYDSRLYGSTGEYGRLFRLNLAGNAWERVCDTYDPGEGNQIFIYSLIEQYGVLYAGTYPDANLFRLNGTGDSWEQVCSQYGSDPAEGAYSLIVYQDSIYAGVYESGILLKASPPAPPSPVIQVSDIGAFMFIDTSAPTNDFYVQSSGDDHWNAGGIDDPFRTLDKAMLGADSTIHVDGGHYDSFYLDLKAHNIELNQLYVYTSLPQHFVSYLTLTATDATNGYVALPTFVSPDDSCSVALNIVGGPAQNYGTDYVVEYGSLLWDGYTLEDYLAAGDTLRIVFEGPLQYKALNTLILHQHSSNYEQEKAIFVAPSGSDSTVLGGDGTNSGGNGTRELPYRTVDMALSQSNPGDNIVAMAGEYPLFSGLDDRTIVAGHDRTSVPERSFRRYFEDFFFPQDFRAYGTSEYDPTVWSFDYSGNSNAFSGGGFLNLTFDGTNRAAAESSFDFVNDFELRATMRNAIDPVTFKVTAPDNTAFFTYNNSQYLAGVITGDLTTACSGSLAGGDTTHESCLITEYISITADDTRNKYAALSYVPEPSDCSNVAVNIVGGVPQNYDEDFYVEDSKIKWDNMALEGELEPGEVLRAIYLDRSLSYPVTAAISLEGDRFTIKAFNGTWHTVMKRDMVGSYTGPWKTAFVMDTTDADISHLCIYGKGFINKFLAVAESFDNLDISNKSYDLRTERRNIAFYEES